MAKRILYLVTEDWYFLSHRLPMARAARDAGFEVHVATRVDNGAEAIAAEGFALHPLSWRRGSVSPLDNLRATWEVRALLSRLQPKILHNIALKPVLIGSLAATGQQGLAVVNSLAGLGSVYLGRSARVRAMRGIVTRILRWCLDRPRTRAVVQNPDDRTTLEAMGITPHRIVLIPGSGVDTDTLTPFPEPDPPITAAYVGRMLQDKGLHALRAAYALLRARGRNIELLLAGDCDPENPGSLSAQEMKSWAGESQVTWLGHVDDIAQVWERAHIAVLPSRREGMPKSLLEAAACGRPLIATDVPGCREVARAGETALLVPVDDAAALADALQQMADDADMRRRFGQAARKLVETTFSAKEIGRQTAALYEALLPATD